jgi:hypothetical protein
MGAGLGLGVDLRVPVGVIEDDGVGLQGEEEGLGEWDFAPFFRVPSLS